MNYTEKINKSGLKSLTVKELQGYIRQLTGEANVKIMEYTDSGTKLVSVDSEIKRLYSIGGENRSKNGVGYGFRGKKKTDLILQARELTYFNRVDTGTNIWLKQASERERKAYHTFLARHKSEIGNITFDEWRKMMIEVNSISDVLTKHGFGGTNGGKTTALDDLMIEYSNTTNRKKTLAQAFIESDKEYTARNAQERIIDVIKRLKE